jgi:glycosyltransferase involved in cell wall biosynthesis
LPYENRDRQDRELQVLSELSQATSNLETSVIDKRMTDCALSAAPRTIAWLVQGNEDYGVRRAVLSLTLGVQNLGWHTPIISLSAGAFCNECRDLGYTVQSLNLKPVPALMGGVVNKTRRFVGQLLQSCRVRTAVAKAVSQFSPDALHVLWPSLVSLAGWAAKRNRVAAYWEMPNCLGQGYLFDINQRVYNWQCKRYSIKPLANSRYTATTLGNTGTKPTVCHLGCDPIQFDPQRGGIVTRKDLGIPQRAIVLGVVARLSVTKGQDRVLQAIRSLEDSVPPIFLVLLGGPVDGALAGSLRDMAQRWGMTDRLRLLGRVPDPQRYYGLMDIVVNSRVDPEPFGLSVIEAMMMGRPVLAHALGGPAETVIDGVTGWHVRNASVASLAAGIRRAIADRRRWPDMSKAARSHALEHFSIRVQTRRYAQILQDAYGGACDGEAESCSSIGVDTY